MRTPFFLIFLWVFAFSGLAHPFPDLPVRADFKFNGEAHITVEIDPRCFEVDPEKEPYLVNGVYQALDKKDLAEMEKKANALIAKSIKFSFDPPLAEKPVFTYRYTTLADKPIDKKDQTPVVLQADWKFKIPLNTKTYQITALPEGKYSVQFINSILGQQKDLNVLFPKESSYKLDLSLVSRIRKAHQKNKAPR